MLFQKWNSIPRLNKEVIITEKIDGSNAQIHIISRNELTTDQMDWAHDYNLVVGGLDFFMFAGSRNRYLNLEDDNFGFANWVKENSKDLFRLGPGRHYGEWYGLGINRGYGLTEKRLAMFNPKWELEGPECVTSVPILGYTDGFDACLYLSQVSAPLMIPSGWYFCACFTIAHLRSLPFPLSSISLASFSGSLTTKALPARIGQTFSIARRPSSS